MAVLDPEYKSMIYFRIRFNSPEPISSPTSLMSGFRYIKILGHKIKIQSNFDSFLIILYNSINVLPHPLGLIIKVVDGLFIYTYT